MLAVGKCCCVAVCLTAAEGASAPTGGGGVGHTVAASRLQLVLQSVCHCDSDTPRDGARISFGPTVNRLYPITVYLRSV